MRYLRIGVSLITELPVEIGKLQHLETLDLRRCNSVLRLPSTVVQLQKLVHLFVSPSTGLPVVEFGSMQALEALENLNIWNTDNPMKFAEGIGHLTKLRELGIELSGEHFKDYATRERLMGILVPSIIELGKCNLRYLSITQEEKCERLFQDPCCTYLYLQDLIISLFMVPKGMASLGNLVKLCIEVREFDKEGLHLLMGMPSLAHLDLVINRVLEEKLTIVSNGFKLLKVFHYRYLPFLVTGPGDKMRIIFAAGSAPALQQLHFQLSPMVVASDFFAEFGIEHLTGLAHLHVVIQCYEAATSRLETLESSIERAKDLHPNCEIHVTKLLEHYMYKDEKEWEEAVARKIKQFEESRKEESESREEATRS